MRLVLLILSLVTWSVAANAAVRALPVPTVTILPGQVIGPEQMTAREFETSPRSLAGIATEDGQVIGREARRRLVAGRPVPLGGLGSPLAVRRGAPATAVYAEDGFSISTSAIALEDGAVGDVIDARATETGAIIKVQVLADGQLAVIGE